MQIQVRVVTNAKKARILKQDETYKIYVAEKPEKGKANEKVIELVAHFFKIKKSQVRIVKGLKSKEKTLVITL